jgi:hypothetical protein
MQHSTYNFVNTMHFKIDLKLLSKTSYFIFVCFFNVLLTVHIGKIPVNDQLDAQFFFLLRLFQFSICFEQPRAHHQENQFYQYNICYMSLCVSDSLVCRLGRNFLHTRRSPTQSDIYQMLY